MNVRLTVETARVPDPALLRAAIEARLAGQAFPSRAEDAIAEHVARLVEQELERPWR
jgi:hypothetical protein